MKFPWLGLELSAGILIWAAIPIVALTLGSAGVGSLPENLPSKAGFDILNNDFSPGLLSPTNIVIDGAMKSSLVQKAVNNLVLKLLADTKVSSATPQVYTDKNLAVVTVSLLSTGNSASDEVAKIRSDYIPPTFAGSGARVLVGGEAAHNLDFTNLVKDYTPKVFSFVLGLSFLLLLLAFRSLVVPIKAIIMNLLSVGAAYGIMVAVFQKGILASFFHFQTSNEIESWIPLFLFAVLFGLSMDYHVFLLSRIKEQFDKTLDNTASVAFGLSSTGRLITGAALIMVAVFSAFAAGSLVMFQQVGFGLAVSILLDATLVRSILVPSSMKLLGKWNWYLPFWLKWLPRIGIEG